MKLIFILDYDYFGSDYLTVAKTAACYCDMLWFRTKSFTDSDIYAHAVNIREALPDSVLILSERVDIAVCAGFDGVHLNSRTVPPQDILEAFPALITGYSAHSAEECGIKSTYKTLSPIFPTKKAYAYANLGPLPAPAPNVYALGGINMDTLPLLKGQGYEGVAGITLYHDLARIYEYIKTETL